jgi:hypothetical protein
VSHVSIVADGPFLGKPDDTKEGWKEIAGSIAGSMSKLAKPNSRVWKNKRMQGWVEKAEEEVRVLERRAAEAEQRRQTSEAAAAVALLQNGVPTMQTKRLW